MIESDDSNRGKSDEANKIDFRYYTVAMLDLLGQNEILRNMSELPKTDEQKKIFIEHARNSWGRLNSFRTFFMNAFERFSSGMKEVQQATQLPEPYRTQFRELGGSEIKGLNFGDMFGGYTPLMNRSNYFTLDGVYGLVTASISTLLASLVRGIPLRGAIEVGIAAKSSDNDFYGPILAEVHYLESKVAQFPRIVIGQRLFRMLEDLAVNRETSPSARWAAQRANECLSLIRLDIDGIHALDFLSENFAKFSEPNVWAEFVRGAFEFAKGEHIRFQKEGKQELAIRYALLCDRFSSLPGFDHR